MLKKSLLIFSLFISLFFGFLPARRSFNEGGSSGFRLPSSVIRPPTVQAAIDSSCQNVASLSLDAAIACQQQVERELNMLKTAIKPNEDKFNQLKIDINQIIKRAAQIGEDLKEKEELLAKGKNKIAVSKKIFDAKVRQFYKHSQNFSPILIFFAKNQDVSKITKELAYQQKTADVDKQNITSIALYVKNVEQKKKELENENTRLSNLQTNLNSQITELEKLLAGAKSYETVLSDTVARLSARQQDIIAQRIGSLHLPSSLGAGPLVCTDDRTVDPGFTPAFAFFTFGIPHRVGMNQYGAKGRAEAGQGYQDILRAYFSNINFETRDNIKIRVAGFGEMNIEDYLLGIYEIPESWHIEALKAQVVAARSYALAYTDNGSKEICTSQECQVYKGGNKGGNWETAVRETTGQVMTNNGKPISAWFSSTFGGYSWGSGDVWCENGTYTGTCGSEPWTGRRRDTNGDVSSFSDLMQKSYDKESPCLYAAQGWRSQYGKSAWLKSEEVANIVNALLLSKANGSVPDGIESWSSDKIKQEVRNKNENPFNSVSDVSVSADFGIGKTNNVTVSGDAGSRTFDGLEFRNIFNLVAPANIAIVGPLYNVERK